MDSRCICLNSWTKHFQLELMQHHQNQNKPRLPNNSSLKIVPDRCLYGHVFCSVIFNKSEFNCHPSKCVFSTSFCCPKLCQSNMLNRLIVALSINFMFLVFNYLILFRWDSLLEPFMFQKACNIRDSNTFHPALLPQGPC
jgi:hypothetical protein